MIGFLLGISLTLNVITIIGLIIYFSVKNKTTEKLFYKFGKNLNDDEIDDISDVKDFMKDDKVDFSSLLKR